MDVKIDRTDGIHHFLHFMCSSSSFSISTEEMKRIVENKAWNRKKKQQSWKISLRIESSLVSFIVIFRAKRSSSLCQSFKSKKWPGLLEISIIGCCWIADEIIVSSFFSGFSCSTTGISTMLKNVGNGIIFRIGREEFK